MLTSLFQLILHDRKLAYAITDRDLRVLEVGGALAVLGNDPGGWAGQSLLDLVPELVGSEMALAGILAGTWPRLELPWVNRETADGRPLYLLMVELPYQYAAGRITGLLHLVQDWTEAGILRQQLSQQRNELRLAQDQLARQNLQLAAANAELRRLDEIKSTFVSVAAHELRTPLTAIQGYVEMLADEEVGPVNETQREYLSIVQGGAERLLHITHSLLDVTRIEAGQVDLVLRPIDLADLVQSVVAEFEPQVKAKAQHLTLSSIPDLPQALCDPTRAAQIIGNLLGNAIKYTPPEGHVSITLDRAQEEGFLQVSVSDDGLGIAAEDQLKLFRRFFRAAGAAQAGASGAGLGLYIARALAELHGGRLRLDSELGHGSTFYVTFHIAD